MPSARPASDTLRTALALLLALLGGCSETSRLPPGADVGAQPVLGEPVHTLVPTLNIAPAQPWSDGQTPKAAAGLRVQAYAQRLEHPRWLAVLPNGDVLVAETNAPQRAARRGLKAWVMGRVMAGAGAGGASANRISLLRDADGDGQAELRTVFLQDLNSPFGMALVGDHFYVANTDGVWEFPYAAGQTRLDGKGRLLTGLPAGPLNHHWTKSLIASRDGNKLYATVGSNSNVGENGMSAAACLTSPWEIDRRSGDKRLYATGLRNPNGMTWMPAPAGSGQAQQLWTVVNERDEIGSDLVPDYLTSVRDGGFYGWPYSWYGQHLDPRAQPPRPDLVTRAITPDYALGSHVAPLGLAAAGNSPLPAVLTGRPGAGVFIGLHGSWNRRPHAGYTVVYLPFVDGRPEGQPLEVLGGFLSDEGKARGRPVGVAIDASGALLVADDVGNTVWRVTPVPR